MSTQKVIIGNSLHVLQAMEPESIDVCVTSPPYWGLRDYGSEPAIYGGDDGELISYLHCTQCEARAEWTKPEARQ